MLGLLLSIAVAARQATARDLLPAECNAPGCALDVRRDGKTIEMVSTGLADLEDDAAISPDTIFEIG